MATQVILKTKKANPGRKKKAFLLKFSRADHLSNFWQCGQEGEERVTNVHRHQGRQTYILILAVVSGTCLYVTSHQVAEFKYLQFTMC